MIENMGGFNFQNVNTSSLHSSGPRERKRQISFVGEVKDISLFIYMKTTHIFPCVLRRWCDIGRHPTNKLKLKGRWSGAPRRQGYFVSSNIEIVL